MATTRTAPPFDPALAVQLGERWCAERRVSRLAYGCPSRRSGAEPYVLTCDEDGTRPACDCRGYRQHGHCTHCDQSPAIVRTAAYNDYACRSEQELIALDRELTPRFGQGAAIRSIRYAVLGDALARFNRLRDPILLSTRAKLANDDLFGA